MNISDRTKRILLPVMLFLLTAVQVVAQDVTFTASAPGTVVAGTQLRITYTLNTDKYKQERFPDMKGLTVISGPNRSSSISIVNMNGQQSSNSTTKFTFVAIAPSEACTVELNPATIMVDGKQLSSNSLTIKVLPPDQTQSQDSQGQGGNQTSRQQQQSSGTSGKDLFMLATVNKTSVYEQEALLLTYKIYALPSVNLSQMSNTMPDIKNCHVQEVELPRNKEFELEHYNGRNYQTVVWSQFVLFPQNAGELEIPSMEFQGTVRQRIEDDPFDFFNFGSVVEVKRTLKTDRIKVNVKQLPQGKTDAFYGGVGEFSLSSTISSTDVTANDAVTLRYVLSGTGNLKLVKTPDIKFPQDFDVYDPKVDNKFTIRNGRQTGNKVYEYLVIPRHGGEYTIPGVEFQYFDPSSGTYKTLSTPDYTLNVAKGQGGDSQTSVSYVSKEDLKFVGQDVRFHATPQTLKSLDSQFFGSPLFYICLILPLIVLTAVVVISRKRISDNANAAKVRVKKANSVATRRLKAAGKLMKSGRKDEFYDEMMRAVSGYMADKLAIPTSELSKDRISVELSERKVAADLISQVVALLDDCEFARYAPGDDTGRMDRIYDQAVVVIGKIESSVK